MIELKNVLKDSVAEELRGLFLSTEFVENKEESRKPYMDNFHGLPGKGEEYSCIYQRSRIVEKTTLFGEVLRAFNPLMSKYFDGSFSGMAYKMTPGNYFRTHDDITNGFGFIYYLSKGWKWDWGGILTVLQPQPVCVLPKFNHMVIIPKKGTPHFVSRVMEYAKEPRMAIVGFVNGDKL